MVVCLWCQRIQKRLRFVFLFFIFLMLFFVHRMSHMHLLQSDTANESVENIHAFGIIAANGPLRQWGGVFGVGCPVDRHASVSRGIWMPLVNVTFAGHVLTHSLIPGIWITDCLCCAFLCFYLPAKRSWMWIQQFLLQLKPWFTMLAHRTMHCCVSNWNREGKSGKK